MTKKQRIEALVEGNDHEQLKAKAAELGLPTSGNKTELATAIVEAGGDQAEEEAEESSSPAATEASGAPGGGAAPAPPDTSKMVPEEQAARRRGPETVDVQAEKAVHSGRSPHQTKLGEDGKPVYDHRTPEEIAAEEGEK